MFNNTRTPRKKRMQKNTKGKLKATMFNNKTTKKESMYKNPKGKLKERACMQPCSTTKPSRKKACTKTQKESSKTEHACMHTSNHVQEEEEKNTKKESMHTNTKESTKNS